MTGKLNVVTGGTGLLGSHIAEQLVARGERVRALVRPASETDFLAGLGAELVPGDLADVASVRHAVRGADVVYHCAARVGDWARREEFRRAVVEATANLLEACAAERVGRVLYVSSIMVYGRPVFRGTMFTEEEPFGQNVRRWEYYSQAKIEAERLCHGYPGDLTVIRPSWIYGPRDRNGMPRLLRALRAGRLAMLGKGDKLINMIYVGDVADAAIKAANAPHAAGQAYNISSYGELSHKDMLDMATDALGLPRVRRGVSFRLAYYGAWLCEIIAPFLRLNRPPHITRYTVGLVERSTNYSTAKARRELGWQPRTPAREGFQRALEWQLRKEGAAREGAPELAPLAGSPANSG